MMAFSATYMEAGGSSDLLPLSAATERFFAFLGFVGAEKRSGGIAFWPEDLYRYDEKGTLAVANDLILAAAIADLNWDGPFDRDHLLAMTGHDGSKFEPLPL
jgi:hypothetical protein